MPDRKRTITREFIMLVTRTLQNIELLYACLLYGQGYFIGYIRDTSGVFSVCHAREWYIDKFPPFLLLFFQNGRRVQGLCS